MGAGGHAARSTLVSAYYDTSDFAVDRAGFSLRVRTQEGRHIQTLKAKRPYGSALARSEWEDFVASAAPDLSAPEISTQIPKTIDLKDLRLQFTTTVQRSTIELARSRGTRIEAVIDEGTIHTDRSSKTLPIREVELELKKGVPTALYASALQLMEHARFRIEIRTKAERGYSLVRVGGEPEPIVHAGPVPLNADMTVDDAFETIGRHCLTHLLVNERAAFASEAEGVHQMRVAIRRLRSALTAAKPMISTEKHRWSANKLRWIADILAPARNWDVFIAELLQPVLDAVPLQPGLNRLADLAERERRAAYRDAREAMGSERYTASLLRLLRWFEMRAWRHHGATDEPARNVSRIGEIALGLLDRRRRQVRRFSKNFIALTSAERHVLRIALKKLRYTVELFAPLFDEKDVSTYLGHLEPLQDALGRANDLRVAHALVAELCQSPGHPYHAAGRAGGFVLGWHERGLAGRGLALREDVDHMRDAKPYWR